MKPGMFQNYKACAIPILAIIAFYLAIFLIGGFELIKNLLIGCFSICAAYALVSFLSKRTL